MRKSAITAALLLAFGAMGTAHATDDGGVDDIFVRGHIDGELRAYNFDRLYDSKTTPDAHAFSGAALINAQTGSFWGGFGFGTSFVTANSFGTHSDAVSRIDTTLAGPNNSIGAFSQLYAQFKNQYVAVRGGYQYLDNPWMGKNDSRVIPSSYNALSFAVTPIKGWDIYAIRAFTWKSRTSTDMFHDNLYYPSTYDGDSSYGNNGSLPASARRSNGTSAFGTTYVNGGLKAQAWYYNFLGFAKMTYLDGGYTLKTDSPFNPFLQVQYLHETSGSDNILVETQAKLLGLAGNRVDAQLWGADIGTSIYDGKIDFSYNKLDNEKGAVGGGALISPYTVNYATDPLYTTSMIRGLVEEGPGHAWKARAQYNFFDKKLQLVAAYAKYVTDLRGDSHDVYFDIIYNLDQWVKGLTVRNRWERSTGGINNLNPSNQPFVYNRVMITYKF
jgi:hypothetical protein